MSSDDDFDSVWGRMADADAPVAEDGVQPAEQGFDAGAPVRVTILLRADSVPVAPWAQGWRLAAAGPIDGHVTLAFEHDIDAEPVAQLAAVTGLLKTIRAAQLDIAWWAFQLRGPFPEEQRASPPDLEQQLSDFLLSTAQPSAEPDSAAATDSVTLNDGTSIPRLGLGVWQIPDADVAELVTASIQLGYRHIDTAMIYSNERGVGEGIRASGAPRESIHLTTKLWNSDQGTDETIRACETSLELLDVDYIDLYLIHWPAPRLDRYVDAWRTLIELRERGLVRSIGVSNFHEPHLARIIEATGVTPSVNQIELHPRFQQRELRAAHQRLGIATQAWSPLGRGGPLLGDPTLQAIARQHEATTAQVVIAWHLATDNIVIPKSANVGRMAENLAATQLELTDENLASIAALDDVDGRIGPNPETADF